MINKPTVIDAARVAFGWTNFPTFVSPIILGGLPITNHGQVMIVDALAPDYTSAIPLRWGKNKAWLPVPRRED